MIGVRCREKSNFKDPNKNLILLACTELEDSIIKYKCRLNHGNESHKNPQNPKKETLGILIFAWGYQTYLQLKGSVKTNLELHEVRKKNGFCLCSERYGLVRNLYFFLALPKLKSEKKYLVQTNFSLAKFERQSSKYNAIIHH